MRSGDDVAVHVEMGVELREGQLAVALEEREADRAEAPARQRFGIVDERGERSLVGTGRSAAVMVGDDRPDLVAEALGLFEQLAATVRSRDCLSVERGDLDQRGLELGADSVVLRAAEARVEAEEEEVAGVAAVVAHEMHSPGGLS